MDAIKMLFFNMGKNMILQCKLLEKFRFKIDAFKSLLSTMFTN